MNFFFIYTVLYVTLDGQLPPVADDKALQRQHPRLLVSAQDYSPTHYVEDFFIFLDEENNEIAVNLNFYPPYHFLYIYKDIASIYKKYKMPYMMSYYDVDNVAPFHGIYLIVIESDGTDNNNETFINPRVKIYSPILWRVSPNYKVFIPPPSPQDIFITHAVSDLGNKKSLTELFSNYTSFGQIHHIFSKMFVFNNENCFKYCSSSFYYGPRAKNNFISFIQIKSLKGNHKRVALKLPRRPSPGYVLFMREQADNEVDDEEQKLLKRKASFSFPGNPDLYDHVLEILPDLCGLLYAFNTLPPLLPPTTEKPQSPQRLFHMSLRMISTYGKSKLLQQLKKMVSLIIELLNLHLMYEGGERAQFGLLHLIMKKEPPLAYKEEERTQFAVTLNDVLEETKKYFDVFRKRLPPRYRILGPSVISVLKKKNLIYLDKEVRIMRLFLGEELKEALLRQQIVTAIEQELR